MFRLENLIEFMLRHRTYFVSKMCYEIHNHLGAARVVVTLADMPNLGTTLFVFTDTAGVYTVTVTSRGTSAHNFVF